MFDLYECIFKNFWLSTAAKRMDGFKIYVTNTTLIPPFGYLCYEDPEPDFDLPDITQKIFCNQLGKYVIHYDTKGSDEGNSEPGPIVELCYVAIKGLFCINVFK